MNRMNVKSVLTAIALVVLVSGSAWANTITPSFASFNAVTGVLVYNADITSAELHAGDGFTIFDIGNFVSFGTTPAGWTATSGLTTSIQNLGPGPSPPLTTDNATVTNVTYTYNGQTIEILGQLQFAGFTINTTATSLRVDDYVSRDHEIGGIGTVGDGAVATRHNDSIVVTAHGVPDGGSTAVLLGSVVLGFGMLRRKFYQS